MGVLWKQYCASRNCGPLASSSAEPDPIKKEEEGAPSAASERHAQLAQIYAASQSAVSMGEEKLALAVAAYDTIDRHIRRLDIDLLKNERSLHAGLRKELTDDTPSEGTAPLPLASDRFSPEGQHLTFWSGLVSLDPLTCLAYLKEHLATELAALEAQPKRGHKRTASQQATPDAAGIARIAEADIDPSEPRYCYCNRVSYGEMVACDNDDCPREWVRYYFFSSSSTTHVSVSSSSPRGAGSASCAPRRTGRGQARASRTTPPSGPLPKPNGHSPRGPRRDT